MEAFFSVSVQVGVLFLLMAVGALSYKLGYFTESAIKGISLFIINIITPCVIINAFTKDLNNVGFQNLLTAAVSAFFSMGFTVVLFRILTLIYKKITKNKGLKHQEAIIEKKPLMEFAAVYSNSGFMGLPLLNALLGTEGVIYGTIYIMFFNLYIFTHGAMLLSGEKMSLRSLLRAFSSPAIIAAAVAIILFVFDIAIPNIFSLTISHIAVTNTPIPMIIIGARIAVSGVKGLFRKKYIIFPVVMRNIIVPLSTFAMLFALGVRGPLLLGCVLPAAMPIAGNTVIFAEKYDKDTEYAAGALAFSTLISLITIPVIAGFIMNI